MAIAQRSPFNWNMSPDVGMQSSRAIKANANATPTNPPVTKSHTASPYSFDPTYFQPGQSPIAPMRTPYNEPSYSSNSPWKQRAAIALFSGLAVAGALYYENPPLIHEDKANASDISQPMVDHKTVLKWFFSTLVIVFLAETVYSKMTSTQEYD